MSGLHPWSQNESIMPYETLDPTCGPEERDAARCFQGSLTPPRPVESTTAEDKKYNQYYK